MKTKTKSSSVTAYIIKICSFCLLILFVLSCSKEDDKMIMTSQDKGQAELKSKLSYNQGDIVHLSGLSLYKTWMVKGGMVLQDNKWPCVADLEFLDDKNIKFTYTETVNGQPRGFACLGTMAESGVLTFKYPAPIMEGPIYITDIIVMHSGATAIWGPGINEGTLIFKGRFDGKKLTATAPFMVKIEEFGPNNDIFPTPVDGPLHWTFGYDLDVVD